MASNKPCLYASNWSCYPAKKDVDFNCYGAVDVGDISFCKTTASMTVAEDGHIDVSGLCIFSQPPMSETAPSVNADLVTKAYIDAFDYESWASNPAQAPVDLSCNSFFDVSGIEFCDGTYIGYGNSLDISSNDQIMLKSSNTTITASMRVSRFETSAADRILLSTPPQVTDTTQNVASNQMIPRSYLDTLLTVSLPAIAGYPFGTCYNIKKNVIKTSATTTVAANQGNLYYLYPYVDTTISNVVVTTAASNGTYTSGQFAFSLIEFPSITAASGTCIATTGWIAASATAPNPFSALNTRYVIPLGSTQVLKGGTKYAVSFNRNPNTTTFTLLGFGMVSSAYSIGFDLNTEMQSSGSYNTSLHPTLYPAVGDTVTFSGGSGFLPLIGLIP